MPLLIRVRIALGMLLAALAVLAVGGLGAGRVSWAVTHGDSMEPTYHTGDLVVVLRSPSYHVGQVVAYRTAVDDHPIVVLHRIVAQTRGNYLIKGDNNQSVDSSHPSSSQVVGREVVHLPKIGLALRYPLLRVVLAGVVVALEAALLFGARSVTDFLKSLADSGPSGSAYLRWSGPPSIR